MISLKIFSLLLAVYLASALNVPERGNNTLQQLFLPGIEKKETGLYPRIILGHRARHQFTYQVALISIVESRAGTGSLCGGALIASKWVITAATCTIKFDKIKVQLGMVNLTYPDVEYVVYKSNVFPHFDYKGGPTANIALIKIPVVTFKKNIAPISLPPAVASYLDSPAVVAGWGHTSNGGHNSPFLRYIISMIISNEECSKHYGGENVTPATICTGHSKRGICVSDTGSPLMVLRSENVDFGMAKLTKPIIIGIASFGPKEGCGKGFPDGFTRVDHYLSWIQKTIDSNK